MASITASEEVACNGAPTTIESLKLKLQNGTAHPTTLQAPLPNPSLQVTADHKLKAIDAPVFAPKAGEVLLHIKATGVCG
jgi:L-iditol 2-dehydrogenase